MEQLATALGERYAIQRELGRGGMAVVYVARDLRHDRNVAIKVLAPDLAASLGHERFLREIRVAARLSHPGIVPLHDSGDADGLLYYVMPVVEGESLATRLRREGALPVEDALRIAAEVADALDYAGKQGVVHRDIKPGNILLSGGHALVADFGLAHALEQDQAVLTSSGLVVGTPMYMSPEQIGSSSHLDPRSDQYSLGCVIYEMLVGQPPFTGASVQQIFARHAVERVPGIRAVRDAVPEIIEAAVHRAMAKTPADRFATSGDLARVLRGESFSQWSRASLTAVPAAPAAASGQRRRVAFVTMGLLVASSAAAFLLYSRRPPALPLDPLHIAVLPLTAVTPDDSAAASAGGALANLLADRFTGLGGPVAVEASAVRAALARAHLSSASLRSQDVRSLSATLGSGRVLRGQVLASGPSLSVSATIESSMDGTVLARADDIRGQLDSLGRLADQLLASLLASLGGQPAERLPQLQGAAPGAVRSFLAAEEDFAHGRYAAAKSRYAEAIAQDSSLVVAGVGLLLSGQLSSRAGLDSVGPWLLQHEADLPPSDRSFLPCLDKDFLPGGLTQEALDTVRYYRLCAPVAEAAPNRPDIWFQFGLALNQQTWAGLAGARQRAAAAFRHALELDSAYAPALGHLLEIEASLGDTAEMRRLGARYLAIDGGSDLEAFYRWLLAASTHDTASLASFRASITTATRATLDRVISFAQMEGIGLDAASAATTELQRRSSARRDLIRAYQRQMELALNLGRPSEAANLARQAVAGDAVGLYHDFAAIFAALYWDGDTTLAAETVARLAPTVARRDVGERWPPPEKQLAICGLGLWQAARGEWNALPTLIDRLRQAPPAMRDEVSDVCLLVLPAKLAIARRPSDAAPYITALDTSRALDPFNNSWAVTLGNLTVAELYSKMGEYGKALAVIERRAPVADAGAQRVQVALSTLYREEGRLATLAGDKAKARAAYGHYLVLRANAEPSLQPEVERIRREVSALE
jgi:serine/threonine-protein kinase